jgi:hypothetical protein
VIRPGAAPALFAEPHRAVIGLVLSQIFSARIDRKQRKENELDEVIKQKVTFESHFWVTAVKIFAGWHFSASDYTTFGLL